MTLSRYLFRTMTNRLSLRFNLMIISIIGILMFGTSELRKLLLLQRSVEFVLPSQYSEKDDNFDYRKAMDSLNKAHVQDSDLRLIGLIKNYYIENPSTIPYALNKPDTIDPSEGQAAVIDKLLNKKEGGFFVDCGANEGEAFSNSLFLERYRNWDGILIEANSAVYKELQKKNRKSYMLNACLNTKPYPSVATFLENTRSGKIIEADYSKSYRGTGGKGRFDQVQCFPLYSILLALNQTVVDYFSLDVEGAEQGVLDSLPWGKVDIKTISIEYDKWPGGKFTLVTYMEKRGYRAVGEIKSRDAADIIFIKHQNEQ